jgi:hypothetical protein
MQRTGSLVHVHVQGLHGSDSDAGAGTRRYGGVIHLEVQGLGTDADAEA